MPVARKSMAVIFCACCKATNVSCRSKTSSSRRTSGPSRATRMSRSSRIQAVNCLNQERETMLAGSGAGRRGGFKGMVESTLEVSNVVKGCERSLLATKGEEVEGWKVSRLESRANVASMGRSYSTDAPTTSSVRWIQFNQVCNYLASVMRIFHSARAFRFFFFFFLDSLTGKASTMSDFSLSLKPFHSSTPFSIFPLTD